mgnify:CR=1 FL=1
MDETDKRRKTKITIRNLPRPVEWILTNATGEQLDYLDRMAKSNSFTTFVNLIAKFKHYNVYTVFEYKAVDDKDLAIFRAYRKGEVDGLSDLILAAQAAEREIQRRKTLKIK